ncbi:MAG: hypothetical protein FJ149_06615 [Euryarchaeota archaeon]|nr:hypothetical protein [Euryarchaeota archaeon]
MRKALAYAIVIGFVTTGFIGMVQAETPEGKAQGRPMATADGLYWQDDRRLTNNGGEDTYPTLVVDTFGNSFVMYYRDRTHKYIKIDRYGNPLFDEKDIVSAQIPTQHCGQPCERIGIDSQENFHVVWTTQTLYGPMYQKFASNGNPLTQPINLAPMASNPHVVNLAVGKNNRGYFAYENEGSERIEMAYVDNNFNLHTGYLSTTSGEGVTLGLNKKDYPYVFSKSWSGTGMWVTIFSPEGQVFQSPTKVDTPVAGSGWDSPLPALAFSTDGACHMLQASRASGIKTLYYTKLGPDGAKLTNDIMLTSNSNDYGDICVDSKRNVYIIWGDAGDQDIYYVRIQPNQENATLQPVRLTNAPGIDRDPQITVDPEDSLHTSWVSDRDGNKEIYYKFAFSYGVELGMTPDEMAKIMYIHPNETKSANITVRNMGGQNDTMYLGIAGDFYGKEGGTGKDYKGEGYKLWIDEKHKELNLDAQEIRKIPIYVRGAARGTPNEYIKVVVNATSTMNPMKNDTVEFRTYLVVDHRITLKCAERVRVTSAGVPTQYSISVSNIGDIDERVIISVNGPPGWEYEVDSDLVKLRPTETWMLTLKVTPPPDAQADEMGVVTVTGRSEAEYSVKDQVTTHTLVMPYMFIELGADEPEKFVDPGNPTYFTLRVSNYGNMAGTVIIILEIVSGTGLWITSLDTNAVGVAGGETKQVILTVVAPTDAEAGTRLVVRVQGFDAEKRYSAECLVTTIVRQVHNIRVAATPEMQSLRPADVATYAVVLANLGNGAEEVTLGASELPVGWDLSYQRLDGSLISEIDELYLQPGSSLTINAIVRTAVGSLAQLYAIKGRLLDRDKNVYLINMGIEILQEYDIDVTTTLSKQTGVPGGKVLYTIIGKNKGNGFDTLTFETSGLPREWQGIEFRDVNFELQNELSLNASGLERMSLVVPIPAGVNGTSVEFYVTARSLGMVTDSVKLVLDIRMANLVISKVTCSPKTLRANKLATLVVTIDNIGEVNVENVTVRFYQDRAIMGNERLERVSGGTNRTATFTWMAKGGTHSLRFVVDPDNLIVENNKADNQARQTVKVQEGSFLEQLPGFEGPLMLLALAAGAAVLVLRRKK